MTDRVREAVFSIIGEEIVGARVLDLYAGSASLSCEALSRGAAGTTIVEQSAAAIATANTNLGACGFGDLAEVTRVDVGAFSRRIADAPVARRFGVAFVDPPYATDDDSVAALLSGIALALEDGALVVLHRQARKGEDDRRFAWPLGYRSEGVRTYGGTAIHFARHVCDAPVGETIEDSATTR